MPKTRRFKNHRSDQSRGVDLFPGNPSNTATLFIVVPYHCYTRLAVRNYCINKERRDSKSDMSSFIFFMFFQNKFVHTILLVLSGL